MLVSRAGAVMFGQSKIWTGGTEQLKTECGHHKARVESEKEIANPIVPATPIQDPQAGKCLQGAHHYIRSSFKVGKNLLWVMWCQVSKVNTDYRKQFLAWSRINPNFVCSSSIKLSSWDPTGHTEGGRSTKKHVNELLIVRFVLKGPIYNPMDVMNVLMCRRGYRWCIGIILSILLSSNNNVRMQGEPQQRTIPNTQNKDDKWVTSNDNIHPDSWCSVLVWLRKKK